MKYEMKPLFEQRMKELLPAEKDFSAFSKIIHEKPRNFIRANSLKIDSDLLYERLSKKWKVSRPFNEFKEIMVIESDLAPGELGNSTEHLMGYFYVQEISSMLPSIALNPGSGDFVLDVAASPGSKTTQIASMMNNKGTIIANDIKLDRIKILSANLERCGVMNCIVTRNDGFVLCRKLVDSGFRFDKILLDVPCSGEGTLRGSPKTFKMWNIKVVKNLARQQKKLLASALSCLKKNGEIVYSTCTHSPEENEGVVSFALGNFPVKMEKLNLPLKCRKGIKSWQGNYYEREVEECCRIYPQDNDSEGFFVAKFRLLEEIERHARK